MKRVKAQLGSRAKRPSSQKIAEIVGQLFLVGHHLPNKLRRQILDLGPLAVPFLRELLFDPKAVPEPIPGPGLFPLHAASLLGELRATQAEDDLEALRALCVDGSTIAVAIDEALARIRAADAPATVDEAPAGPNEGDDAVDADDPRARLLALARMLAGGGA